MTAMTAKAATAPAVDLESLVRWAIMVQKAHRDDVALHGVELATHIASRSRHYGAASEHPSAWPADSLVRLQEIAAVGARIDGGRAMRGVSPRLHPDAEAVIRAIERIADRRRRGLVLHYARIGEKPDFETGEQRLVKLPAEAGAGRGNRCKIAGQWERVPSRLEIVRRKLAEGVPAVDARGRGLRELVEFEERGFTFRSTDDGGREVLVRWCPVVPEPSVDEIRIVNETYAEWHAGMMALLGDLLGVKLKEHRLTGFRAPARPWDAQHAVGA